VSWLLLLLLLQAAKVLVQPAFLSGPDDAGLIVPVMQILSLGLSAAAVTNFVQSVSMH
jgi:hypothetical protein